MWTRTSDRWGEKPGNFDTVNAKHIYPSSSKYGIPDLVPPTLEELPEAPSCLIPYNLRVRSEMGYADGAMHFFLDDYRFELCWSRPIATLSRVLQARTVLTPDFSLYSDFPVAAQIWNTYRNRWLGAYWHSEGRIIIPTVTWSEPVSYDFCFDGIAPESPVAVSVQGVKANKTAYEYFKHGYREMMRRIKPRFVVCYGKITEDLKEEFPDSPVTCYPTYWEGLRAARKAVAEGKTQSIDSLLEENEDDQSKNVRFGRQI